MKNYIYVPGLSETVENERKKEINKTDDNKFITATGAAKKIVNTYDNGVVRKKKVDDRDFQIPVWEKYALTVKEAAEYYNIAETRLREFVMNNRTKPFVLKAGGRLLVKRKIFETFLDQNNII
ncbi:MAG: helix-turn-helix domain-containing protein [Clostridiales bacterium]|nr:helix-turn-helix domain-containing protein [Clostridiales bacterium]